MKDSMTSLEIQRSELEAAVRAFRCSRHQTGEDIKFARKALGWKRSKLAEKCGAEYTTDDVEAWEKDKKKLPLLAKACMLLALECDLHTVCCRDKP